MTDDQVIYISDDEQDGVTAAARASDSDDVKVESDDTAASSLTPRKRSSSAASDAAAPSLATPERRQRKRRSSGVGSGRRESGVALKPLSPSPTVNSAMNASLVFDMVTSLSTNDPGAAIATLRSIVVLGKEYPSNLLYDELVDRILSVEAVAYADAVAIYASLVFVFDRAASCSCAVSFPYQWEPLAAALQDASANAADDAWRRTLLVLQFYVYCLKQDLLACRARYRALEKDTWMFRSRVFALLQSGDAGDVSTSKASKLKVRNNLILQAVGCCLQLWKRVFDGADKALQPFRLEAEDACSAALRLIEMVYLCTSQEENILQRIQAGVVEMSRETRTRFAQAIQSLDLKVRVATTVMGLTNKSRSTEFEWYESNAMGRVMHAIIGESAEDVVMTDGYSWSHFDSFMTAPPQNDFGRLLQEIARLQQEQ